MDTVSKKKYEFALNRVEELLHVVNEDTPSDHPSAIELAMMSDIVIGYEKIHYPIDSPSISELITSSLEEKDLSQKELAKMIGVSPSRISDYISGRAEPTLKIARALCIALNITPSEMLGC